MICNGSLSGDKIYAFVTKFKCRNFLFQYYFVPLHCFKHKPYEEQKDCFRICHTDDKRTFRTEDSFSDVFTET